jgi:transcription elongation GreA/GreB family factor
LGDTTGLDCQLQSMLDKSRLRLAIIAQLQADLDLQLRAAQLARDEATSDESKAENKYDTRAQEAAYLAEAQARQAAELRESIGLYEGLSVSPPGSTVAVGSIINLRAGERSAVYFLGPRAGGAEVELDGVRVTVVTPSSPLGRQLLGAQPGQMIQLPARPKPLLFTIESID